MPSPSLHDYALDQILKILKSDGQVTDRLNNGLRLLAKYRSTLIQNTLIQKYGTRVLAGPFTGVELPENNAEGCYVPKLLGCYESELHPCWEKAKNSGYEVILNIGCAEGYYAIGLARLLPGAEVRAYDIDQNARRICQRMAEANGVTLRIGARFRGEDFAEFAGRRTLVVCDIEGGELDLLDPAKYPALRDLDLVVELHQTPRGHAVNLLPPRFAGSHEIEILYPRGRDIALPDMFKGLSNLDQLLAVWEWRATPTPWAVMHSVE